MLIGVRCACRKGGSVSLRQDHGNAARHCCGDGHIVALAILGGLPRQQDVDLEEKLPVADLAAAEQLNRLP